MEPVQARGRGCPPRPPLARPTRVLQSPWVASSHMHRAVMTDDGLRPRGPGYTPRAAILALWAARRRGLRRLPSSARRSRRARRRHPHWTAALGRANQRARSALAGAEAQGRWLGCAREEGGTDGVGGLLLKPDSASAQRGPGHDSWLTRAGSRDIEVQFFGLLERRQITLTLPMFV